MMEPRRAPFTAAETVAGVLRVFQSSVSTLHSTMASPARRAAAWTSAFMAPYGGRR